MRHSFRISGHRFALRPVSVDDAAFLVRLRTETGGRFIHQTSPRVEDQIAWIEAYEARAGDYYFIVEDTRENRPVGAVGIYDHAHGQAEWGRWVVEAGSVGAVESALLTYRIAFEQLKLEAVYCRTVADNAQVVSFHDSSGAARAGLLKDHVVLDGHPHDSVEHRVDPALWATMRPRLDMLARRVGRA